MTIDALSLDDDYLLVRGLKGIGAIDAPLPIAPSITPSGLSSVSSIAKAASTEPTDSRSRPELEPPKHFMYGLLRTHSELERVADKQTRLFDSQVKRDMAEIEQLEAEKMEKLRKSAEAVKSQHTWGVLSNVSQYLMSGTAIMLGAAVLPAAPLAGACLIASGVVGLGGRIMHDTGAYQAIAAWWTKSNELQKTIATRIEMCMFVLSFGLGLGGGYYSLGALAVANNGANVQRALEAIWVTAGIGRSGFDFAKSHIEKRKYLLQGDLTKIDAKTNQLYQDLYRNARDAQNLVDTTGDIGDELKQAISASVVHQD